MRIEKLIIVITALAGMLLSGCSDKKENFTVRCRLAGLGSQGVEMVYTDARGVLKRVTGHPDAKEIVEFTGVSAEPTLAELYLSGRGEEVAAFPVKNGEKIEARMTLGQPATLELKGWKTAQRYVAMAAEADSASAGAARNRVVARLVEEHPGELAAAFLLMTRFDAAGHELEADSLVRLLTPEARPQGMFRQWAMLLGAQLTTGARAEMRGITMPVSADSMKRAQLTPGLQSYGLLVVTDRPKDARVRGELRSLRDSFPKSRLVILEAGVQADSAVWRTDIKRDTATWLQGWAPGGVSSAALRRLQVPRVPYCLVTDSTGAILYRGESVEEGAEMVREKLGQAK